jgi:hypothetical protein
MVTDGGDRAAKEASENNDRGNLHAQLKLNILNILFTNSIATTTSECPGLLIQMLSAAIRCLDFHCELASILDPPGQVKEGALCPVFAYHRRIWQTYYRLFPLIVLLIMILVPPQILFGGPRMRNTTWAVGIDIQYY